MSFIYLPDISGLNFIVWIRVGVRPTLQIVFGSNLKFSEIDNLKGQGKEGKYKLLNVVIGAHGNHIKC